MNVYRAPRSVMTCIVAFWSFGMVFAGPVHAQAPLKLLKLDSAPSTSAVCDPATNAAAVAEVRQGIETVKKWTSAIKSLGLPVPPQLSGAIDRLNSAMSAVKMGADLAEAAGEVDAQVQRIVANKELLCDLSFEDEFLRNACHYDIFRQSQLRSVNAVLNWDNTGSVIRRAVSKWLGSKCDPKDTKEVCVNQCRDDMDKDKSEAKCKLLYEADGSCTPKSAVTYRQCVVNTCNATIAAEKVVQAPQPVVAQPSQQNAQNICPSCINFNQNAYESACLKVGTRAQIEACLRDARDLNNLCRINNCEDAKKIAQPPQPKEIITKKETTASCQKCPDRHNCVPEWDANRNPVGPHTQAQIQYCIRQHEISLLDCRKRLC